MPTARILLRQTLPGAPAQQGGQRIKPLAETIRKLFGINAPGGAQAQHEILPFPLIRVHGLGFLQTQLPLEVSVQIPDIAVAHIAEVGIGPGAEAGVLLQEPVFQIVPGGKAGLGEVGDLILLVAALFQEFHGV